MLLELSNGGTSVRIGAVSNHVALVGAGDGFEDLTMNTGVVVAGKAAGRLGWRRKHIE
jgi:hypothetical protein